MKIDVRELLKKYIIHVATQEGVTYVDFHSQGMNMTAEEFAELVLIEKEALDEN